MARLYLRPFFNSCISGFSEFPSPSRDRILMQLKILELDSSLVLCLSSFTSRERPRQNDVVLHTKRHSQPVTWESGRSPKIGIIFADTFWCNLVYCFWDLGWNKGDIYENLMLNYLFCKDSIFKTLHPMWRWNTIPTEIKRRMPYWLSQPGTPFF